MRPLPFPSPILAYAGSLAIALAAAALLGSCGPSPRPPKAVVALDEAFAAARPGLAAKLESASLFGEGPFGLFGASLVLRVTMAEGAGKALDAAIAEGKRRGGPAILVTSPLIAKAIMGGGGWSGDPPLLVPEWQGAEAPGLWSASTDPLPAYGAAGAAAGAFVAALAEAGGAPSCGVVFSEAPSRPRAAINAFAAAYAEASEGRPLYVRELGEQGSAAIRDGERRPESPMPIVTASDAEAAVRELLGSDIRALFVSLGSASGAAIRAAARPGLAIGADFPSPESPPSLAFRILPDDDSLARALDQERRGLGGIAGGAASGESAARAKGSKSIPALLIAGPAAGEARAGKLDFAHFLSEAAGRGQ